MAERMTSIRPNTASESSGVGLMIHGRQTREHMIAEVVKMAEHQMKQARLILECADEDFVVETHTGSIIRRNIEEVR